MILGLLCLSYAIICCCFDIIVLCCYCVKNCIPTDRITSSINSYVHNEELQEKMLPEEYV